MSSMTVKSQLVLTYVIKKEGELEIKCFQTYEQVNFLCVKMWQTRVLPVKCHPLFELLYVYCAKFWPCCRHGKKINLEPLITEPGIWAQLSLQLHAEKTSSGNSSL